MLRCGCNLLRWTQYFPSIWRLLGAVKGVCQGTMSGDRDPSRQHCAREADGFYCWQPLWWWEKPISLLQHLSLAEQAQRKQYLIVHIVCGSLSSSLQEHSSSPGILTCKGDWTPEKASSCMWAGLDRAAGPRCLQVLCLLLLRTCFFLQCLSGDGRREQSRCYLLCQVLCIDCFTKDDEAGTFFKRSPFSRWRSWTI